MTLVPRTVPTKRLAQNLTSTGTSLVLNNILDWDGSTNLASGDFGTELFAVLRNTDNTKLEIIELDPTTIASSAITIDKRALGFDGGTTADTETAYAWNANETIVELGSDLPQLMNNFVDKGRAQTVTGIKTFTASPIVPTPTTDYQTATKKYADDLAIAGAPDGTATVKGIYELATIAEASAQAAAGSGDTTAALAITTALTSNTSSAAQLIPVTDADGDIPVEFMELDAVWAFTGNNTHSGTETFTGTSVDMTGATSVTAPTPTSDSEVATKLYVDQKATNAYTAENKVDEGDLLYISDANKVKRYSPESGTSAETATALNAKLNASEVSKVVKMSDTITLFVAGAGDSQTSIGGVQVGTLDADETDFTYGTAVDLSDGGVSLHSWDLVKLTDTKFISIQRTDEATDQLVARAFTLVGTAITAGTEYAIEATASNTDDNVRIARVSDTQAIALYRKTGGTSYATLMVLDISGTTITGNTAYETSNANLSDETSGLIMWDATTGMIISAKSGTTGLYAQLFSISGTVVTWGNALTIDASMTSGATAELLKITSTTAVVKWLSSVADVNSLALITTDGTDITLGTPLEVANSHYLYEAFGTMDMVSDTIFVSTRNKDAAVEQYMRFYEISGTTITAIGTEYALTSAGDNDSGTSIAGLVAGKYTTYNPTLTQPQIVTCTDFYKARIGVANADAAKDASVTITLTGREASEYTGLTAASEYRVGSDGRPTLLTTGVDNQFGIAINTTDIFLR